MCLEVLNKYLIILKTEGHARKEERRKEGQVRKKGRRKKIKT